MNSQSNESPKGWAHAALMFADHPLVNGIFFYSLPLKLVEQLKLHPILRPALAADTLQLDSMMAEDFEAHGVIGLWKGGSLSFPLLTQPPSPEAPAELLELWGWTKERFQSNWEAIQPKLDAARTAAQAQVGWLFLQPLFVQEHRALLQNSGATINTDGMPKVLWHEAADGFLQEFGATQVLDEPALEFAKTYHAFCKRWDLCGLTGPYLPLPLQPHSPSLPHGLSENPYREKAATLSWPPGAPVPEAMDLRRQLEDLTGRKTDRSEMRGWYAVVENANRNREKELGRYARLFKLMHFWRVLYQHYGPQLFEGNTERLQAVFADFLEVSEDAIHKDMAAIRHAVGPDWYIS